MPKRTAAREIAQQRAAELQPIIVELRAAGFWSHNGMARELNARGIPTMSGTGRWYASTVGQLLRQTPSTRRDGRRRRPKPTVQ
jgi:hypothetical protein